jgi:hypothetical protein
VIWGSIAHCELIKIDQNQQGVGTVLLRHISAHNFLRKNGYRAYQFLLRDNIVNCGKAGHRASIC